jgi:hypothetical protein
MSLEVLSICINKVLPWSTVGIDLPTSVCSSVYTSKSVRSFRRISSKKDT